MPKVGILPCGGACNVGMITIKATLRLLKNDQNVGYVCPLGLPLGLETIVSKARAFDKHIALNGCELECASKALQSINIEPDRKVHIMNEYKIAKNKNFDDESELDLIVDDLTKEIQRLSFNKP